MKALEIDRPRIYVIASISIIPCSICMSRAILSPNKYSKLSRIGAIQGIIFSSIVPGKNPISLPMGWTGRVIISLSYPPWDFVSCRTCSSPHAAAIKVFPVPACPVRETIWMDLSNNKSIAYFCSVFLADNPQISLYVWIFLRGVS